MTLLAPGWNFNCTASNHIELMHMSTQAAPLMQLCHGHSALHRSLVEGLWAYCSPQLALCQSRQLEMLVKRARARLEERTEEVSLKLTRTQRELSLHGDVCGDGVGFLPAGLERLGLCRLYQILEGLRNGERCWLLALHAGAHGGLPQAVAFD